MDRDDGENELEKQMQQLRAQQDQLLRRASEKFVHLLICRCSSPKNINVTDKGSQLQPVLEGQMQADVPC